MSFWHLVLIATVVSNLSYLVVPLVFPEIASAQQLIKVAVQFQHSGVAGRDAAQGSGRVVITERGSVRPRAGVGVESRETRTTQTTGVFTLVTNGGEAMLTMAHEVPSHQIAFFQDYATGQGYVTTGVAFRSVGTSMKVNAATLADGRIRVRLTPTISYFSADGSGTIEMTNAATDVVVRNGQPVVIAGGTTQTTTVTRQIFGLGQTTQSGETMVLLTATLQ